MSDFTDLTVYFHRLAPGRPSEEILHDFYRDGFILCHYEDIASFSNDDYEEDAGDIEDMAEFAESGGICLVQLDADNEYYDRGRIVGTVPPSTEPVIVGVDREGKRTEEYTDAEAARRELEENEEVDYIYKGVKLEDNVRELDAGEYLLSDYEPPFTTFTAWDVVEEQIRSFLSGEELPTHEVTSYSPDQTERLCEEYLREEYEYYPLIQPGGSSGNHQSFDLVGGIGDSQVFGEVKNMSGVSDTALDDLKAEAGEQTRTFYFSRNPIEESREGVEVVLLEDVLETLADIDRTREMMEQMTTW